MEHVKQRQLQRRAAARTFRTVHPTEREVLLARLLLSLIDSLGNQEDLDAHLYDEVKSFAEPIVRGGE